MFLFDRYIPISHFLENHLQSKNSKAQTLLIPPICDFDNFQSLGTNNKNTNAYFLFCGSAAYSEVVVFIIESYLKMKNRAAVQLYLVLSGKCEPSLQALIDSNKSSIKVFSNLDYTDLITLYKNALGLLVPLREIIQDEARFPQKICEYVASGKIIISTNVGEVKFYFKDLSNAVLADNYTTDSYSQKLDWVVSNEDKLKVLETNSYDTGKKYFDYKAYVLPLKTSLK
jgi:glycosyltransferase involved in cell wall biosynthesis